MQHKHSLSKSKTLIKGFGIAKSAAGQAGSGKQAAAYRASDVRKLSPDLWEINEDPCMRDGRAAELVVPVMHSLDRIKREKGVW